MSNLEVQATPERITVTNTKEGIKTTIIPTTQEAKLVTKAVSQISDTGIPTNKDLDELGDKIWEFLETSKQNAPDVKTERMVDQTQKVVGDFQQVIKEKNYDERLQEISTKLKETPKDLSGLSMEVRGDAEKIRGRLRAILPHLFSLSKAFIGDYQFRDLIVTLLDILQNSYERSQEGTPEISETVKEDIMDTTQNEPNRTEDALKEKVENVKKYMNLTEQEKDELLDKFAQSLANLRRNRHYYDFVDNTLKLYDELVMIWERVQNNPELDNVYSESSSIMNDIRVVFERASNRSLDRWIGLVQDLSRAREDPEFVSARRDLEDLLFDREGKYQNKEQIKEKYRNIKEQLEGLNNEYNNVFDEISHESRQLINGITSDPTIAKLKSDFDVLFREIFTDVSGKPSTNVAGDAAMKIRNVFYPIIKEKLANVSLPIIEVDSEKYQFRVEDFYLKLADMLPDQLNIETDSSIQVDFDKMTRNGFVNLRVSLFPMSVDVKKIKFLLNKKTGIKYLDYGIADIKLRDCGIYFHFKITLESDKVDRVEMERVDSNFDGLTIKIIDSKHDVLDRIITTIFIPVLRAKVKSAVDESLMDTINNGLCNQINSALRSM